MQTRAVNLQMGGKESDLYVGIICSFIPLLTFTAYCWYSIQYYLKYLLINYWNFYKMWQLECLYYRELQRWGKRKQEGVKVYASRVVAGKGNMGTRTQRKKSGWKGFICTLDEMLHINPWKINHWMHQKVRKSIVEYTDVVAYCTWSLVRSS